MGKVIAKRVKVNPRLPKSQQRGTLINNRYYKINFFSLTSGENCIKYMKEAAIIQIDNEKSHDGVVNS